MGWRRRVEGGRFAVRVAVVGLIPITALTVLAIDDITEQRSLADAESELAEAIEIERNISEVYPLANLERIALAGLAAIDDLGVDRPIVTQLTGVDFEGMYDANRSVLDDRLDRLRSARGAIVLDDGTTLGDSVEGFMADLGQLRNESEQLDADFDEVREVFDGLDDLLRAATSSTVRPAVAESTRNDPIVSLARVLQSAGELSQAVTESLTRAGTSTTEEIIARGAEHQVHLESLDELLEPEDRERFEATRSILLPAPRDLLAGDADDPGAVTSAPDDVRARALAVLNQVQYLVGLEQFSADFHERALETAQADAGRADTRATRTIWSVTVIAVLAALFTVLVLIGTVGPLIRLGQRASAISNGEIDPNPIPLRGPRLVRGVITAMNEMLVTLHGVDKHLERMSSSEADQTDVDLPGALGVSIRQSVDRLTELTTQLQRSEEVASAIVAEAADAIWTVDRDGVIRFANASSAGLTGVEPLDQVGRSLDDFLVEADDETTVRSPSGTRDVLVARSRIDAGNTEMWTVIAHDISERKRFEAQLAAQARRDTLTELPNRFAAMEHLDGLQDARTPHALLFIDVDGFKSVNDTQGHEAGDAVLVEIGQRLLEASEDGGFTARLGGDEFVMIRPDISSPDMARELGRRIIRAAERPYDSAGHMFSLSASIGIVLSDGDLAPLESLRRADSALYVAKRRGRGRVELFDATLQAGLHREADLALALRQGVRNEEFVVHLQPIMSLHTGTMESAEALVRWNRPNAGLVSPAEFVPIAERSSVIMEIGRWVLWYVCDVIADWRRTDPDRATRSSVNISGRHLIDGDLIEDLDLILGTTGADPRLLEIELTETHLLEDIDKATRVLDVVRARGITVAVDDFGTGYSSMSSLRDLPVDVLKIDGSFIARAGDERYDSTVIEAMLTIARSLDLEVVAEGIETVDQLDFVRAHGCDRAQGFLLARPMATADAEAVLFGAAQPHPAVTTPL